MNKRAKLIITTIVYAAVICAVILLVSRLFFHSADPQTVGEVVYEGIELSAPLYPSAPGTDTTENKHVSIDFSNVSQGYVSVRYKGDSTGGPVMKIIFGETEYTYTLGGEDIFPLNCGDGKYTVKVYQRLRDGSYKSVMTKTLSVELENQLLPYLYPSQLVNYTASSITVQYSDDMYGGLKTDLEKLQAMYGFIIENIEYDYVKAANVEKGYIPSVDSTYISISGICFDYSVMLAAMLRTQRIPAKLVMGYLNGTSVFHAWNEVYLRDSGWVTVNIFIDTNAFSMLDTTLAASQSDEDIARKLNDPEVYLPAYKY